MVSTYRITSYYKSAENNMHEPWWLSRCISSTTSPTTQEWVLDSLLWQNFVFFPYRLHSGAIQPPIHWIPELFSRGKTAGAWSKTFAFTSDDKSACKYRTCLYSTIRLLLVVLNPTHGRIYLYLYLYHSITLQYQRSHQISYIPKISPMQ